MEVNKVETADGEVLIDLTADTVTEEDVNEGITFHGADGKVRTGTAPDKMPYISGKTPILLTDTEEAYSKETIYPYAVVNSIGGKSAVWNPLINPTSYSILDSKQGTLSEENGIITSTLTQYPASADYAIGVRSNRIVYQKNHIYYFTVSVLASKDCRIANEILHTTSDIDVVISANSWTKIGKILVADVDAYKVSLTYARVVYYDFHIGDYFSLKNHHIIDLTAMFGAGNEPTTTDDPRVKWIEAYAEAHPEYNAGEIISAEVERIITNSADGLKPQVYPIPEAIRQLDGYGVGMLDGSVCNMVDYGEKTYTQNCYVDGLEVKMLETPIITDLSAILTDDFLIECESGGTVTFGNESELSIPNEVEYITEADFAKRKANKIDVLSVILTLTADGWADNQQTLTFLHDTAKLNTIIVEPESLADYGAAVIYPISETYSGIVFGCTNTPTADIKIKVKSEAVRNA